jgi:phage-related protein
MEALRDRIMHGCGSMEPWYLDEEYLQHHPTAVSANWRKPLSLTEINQMAQTPEVRQRLGRP